MENVVLNYRYRFPRITFKNGEHKYGILHSYFNKVKQKLEYYFADANQLRKLKIQDEKSMLNFVKQMNNEVLPSDVIEVAYHL